MESKKWYTSKTVIANVLAAVLVIVQALQGQPWLDPEMQAAILAVINVLLRLVTRQPVSK